MTAQRHTGWRGWRHSRRGKICWWAPGHLCAGRLCTAGHLVRSARVETVLGFAAEVLGSQYCQSGPKASDRIRGREAEEDMLGESRVAGAEWLLGRKRRGGSRSADEGVEGTGAQGRVVGAHGQNKCQRFCTERHRMRRKHWKGRPAFMRRPGRETSTQGRSGGKRQPPVGQGGWPESAGLQPLRVHRRRQQLPTPALHGVRGGGASRLQRPACASAAASISSLLVQKALASSASCPALLAAATLQSAR